MLRQSITLMFALAGFGLISGCGGAAMSGDSGTSKDKKKKDVEAIDAAEPYVVTGAYLSCDFAETRKDVGCSLLSSTGERIKPTQVDNLDYLATVEDGDPLKIAQRETPKWGAVWSNLSQLPKTRFKAIVEIKGNTMQFGCTSVPCTSVPAFGLSGINGIITPSPSNTSGGAFDTLQADEFCDASGKPISQEDFLDLCAKGKCGAGFRALGNGFVEGAKNFLDDWTGIFTPKSKKTLVTNSLREPDTREFTAVSCIRKKLDGSPNIKKGNKCSVVAYKPDPNSKHEYFAIYPVVPEKKALTDLNQVQTPCK
jgi:hypothetical protein